MKKKCLIIFLIVLTSCRENTTEINPDSIYEVQDSIQEVYTEQSETNDTIEGKPTIMVIPCSNGYDYNLKMGDLNPSLEKYLDQDDRIILKPFPYNKMQGSGYFGVFDKKQCGDILKRVDVDYLIMTRMRGLTIDTMDSESEDWGYETRVLDVEEMKQFDGISARQLNSFEMIDPDIESKTNELINTILATRSNKE